ncbi:hydrolase [Rapidithrix thailandica]|uniref:Hydrolase n=1 Tax=Rapidithrix thailandica TaxID=413964 RepID=A0AAW9RWA3_9BACT
MEVNKQLKIAVDFDGTIVENKYPDIGPEMINAFEVLREMQAQGHRLILWTFRHGEELEEAVKFCRDRGVEFYAVNHSFPNESFDADLYSRKVDADVFIDDRSIGGFIGWQKVRQLLNPKSGEANFKVKGHKLKVLDIEAHSNYNKKLPFYKWLFKK